MMLSINKVLHYFAGIVIFTLFGTVAQADDSGILRQRLQSMQALSADFSSRVVRKDNSSQSSSGIMALKRPDKLLMHTLNPDEQILFTQGNDIYYFDPFVNQLSIYSRSTGSASPFLLLTDSSDLLWSQYEVVANGNSYTVKPLKSRDITAMTLSFKGQLVSELRLEMKDGSINTYTLSNVSTQVSDSLFKVDIPSDAEVDDERGAN